MTAAEAKKIPIAAILGEPAKTQGGAAWYFAPWRQEKTPSLRVDLAKNLWYDHGAGAGGTIIDLVVRLKNISVKEALREIEAAAGGSSSFSLSPAPSPAPEPEKIEERKIKIEEVCTLSSRALLDYLASRGIRSQLAKTYLKEAHYRAAGKRFYSIAWRNDKGGYELRNKYMKSAASPKAITFIEGTDPARRGRQVALFEGFFDFLAMIEYVKKRPAADVIVLNSLSLLPATVEQIRDYKSIHCYLDRDAAGKGALNTLKMELGAAVVDQSGLYDGYKDLSEWWENVSKK